MSCAHSSKTPAGQPWDKPGHDVEHRPLGSDHPGPFSAYRLRRCCAMRRPMRKTDKADLAAAAAPDKVGVYAIGEDDAGMRLDRWLHRRFPSLPNTHLMKIVRKGEVRVSGKRAEVSTRLEIGQTVRVPPLKLAAPAGPAVKRTAPGDAEAIRGMIL